MNYIQLKIYTSAEGIEPITALLLEKGIDGAVIHDPADLAELVKEKDKYGWDYVDDSAIEADGEPTVEVYMDETEEGHRLVQEVKAAVMELKDREMENFFGKDISLGRLDVEVVKVDDTQWKDKWKEYFHPVKVTERLVVKPTWESYAAAPDELVIELDPGMAFGTGAHETTTLCLQLMEEYLKPEQKVLDAGCGSGILSIAADLLGAAEVLAVDIDPEAAAVARENIKSGNVSVRCGDLTKGVDFKGDMVVANLTAELLTQLSPAVPEHLNPSGIYISSGILIEKKETVAAVLAEAGFIILKIVEKGEWCAIAATME